MENAGNTEFKHESDAGNSESNRIISKNGALIVFAIASQISGIPAGKFQTRKPNYRLQKQEKSAYYDL